VAASRYRIVLRGRLSERFESAFDGMTLEHGPGRTVLAGDVRDQAQLYGLLDRLQEFGIELLAVESAEISDGGSEPAAGLLPEIGPAATVHGDGGSSASPIATAPASSIDAGWANLVPRSDVSAHSVRPDAPEHVERTDCGNPGI
jgi:hypothetical protein